MENVKPKIVWLCDVRGWAYDQRVNVLKERLKEYEHDVFYIVEDGFDSARASIMQASIIVCMYVRYVELLDELKNVVCFVGGKRAFE